MTNFINISTQIGESIPPQTEHAVSVSLPTWAANVGYEEGDPAIIDKLTTGYPRFFIHLYIKHLCSLILKKFSSNESIEKCLIFSSYNVAKRCREYIKVKRQVLQQQQQETNYPIRILQLSSEKPKNADESRYKQECKVSVIFVHSDDFPLLKQYWQHTGEGISSRVAEYMLKNLFNVDNDTLKEIAKGHINTANTTSTTTDSKSKNNKKHTHIQDKDKDITSNTYIEERFGRSLDMSMGQIAKSMIKKRIALKVVDEEEGLSNSDNTLPQPPAHQQEHDQQQRDHRDSTSSNHSISHHIREINSQFTQHVVVVEGNSTEHTPTMTTSNLLENSVSNEAHRTGMDDIYNNENNIPVSSGSSAIDLSDDYGHRDSTMQHQQQHHVDPSKDVYLFPSGMAAIFTAHRLLLELDSIRVKSRISAQENAHRQQQQQTNSTLIGYGPPYKKTVMFGFPYTDTLSVLQKFNHTHFLPIPKDAMAQLEKILQTGEQILAVFLETPSNPLLEMGDILKLQELSKKYGFYIVVDDTIGGFINLDILPHADIVVSSLTKIFSGDSNVMAGSLVLNKNSNLYNFAINEFFVKSYEDLLWCEDAICLERNSRNFVQRSLKVNKTTEWLIDTVLKKYEEKIASDCDNEGLPLFAKIYYPKYSSTETRENYNLVKTTQGGYGEVFSLVFHDIDRAKIFFDNLKLCKGPSLGTNFTLSCPYTVIAHYTELEQVAKYGVSTALVRLSVGLEDPTYLQQVFQFAIDQALKK